MHPHEVEQAPGYQGLDLQRVDEQFAHRQRHRALRPQHAEVADVLGRQRILQEEQTVGFQLLGQTHRIDRRQALVDGRAAAPACGGRPARTVANMPATRRSFSPGSKNAEPLPPVSANEPAVAPDTPRLDPFVAAELAADVAEAALPQRLRLLQHLLRLVTVGMHVDGRAAAAAAAPELVAGHARRLALDIPQRHLQRADGVVQHRAVAPVAVVHGAVPEVGDGAGVAADGERLEVAFDGRLHGPEALGEGAAAPAVQPGWSVTTLATTRGIPPRLDCPGHDVGDAHAVNLPRYPTRFAALVRQCARVC